MRHCCDEISAYLPPLLSSLQPLLELLQGHLPPRRGGQWLSLAFVPDVIGMLQDHLKRLAWHALVQVLHLQVCDSQDSSSQSNNKTQVSKLSISCNVFLSCFLSEGYMSWLFSQRCCQNYNGWDWRCWRWIFLVYIQLVAFATCHTSSFSSQLSIFNHSIKAEKNDLNTWQNLVQGQTCDQEGALKIVGGKHIDSKQYLIDKSCTNMAKRWQSKDVSFNDRTLLWYSHRNMVVWVCVLCSSEPWQNLQPHKQVWSSHCFCLITVFK